ncbi:hypothetical protein GQR60_12620 [Labilibaculum sp. A4]|uniref:MBL fold metallo-hydrolase n=1 Tax=Labilibaculum euxinus TaxID=2686357 RepID=UPI000F620347|nr:MBL fold metallo-hydrolase [Labilibaculum euxinus]MDQ1771398.1 hypothetical protein [Labilibaculum euxinus]MWN77186.1 hypothetical protein [Labilibaculum euxinus]
MDFSIDMIDLKDADSIIVWSKENNNDYITIIDGGNPNDSKDIISHYETYIAPHVNKEVPILMINTHPHKDHIGGLIDLVNYFGRRIARFYYNNPIDYIDDVVWQNLGLLNESIGKTNKKVKKVFESIQDAKNLSKVLEENGITPIPAFSDTKLDHNIFSFVGPSKEFYLEQLAHFTNLDILKANETNIITEAEINEVEEGLKPCVVLDEQNDTSAENLTSVLTQFTDTSNRKYLFTSDAGVDSFESAESNGFDMTNFHICQLPHHGSRRSVNTNWLSKLNPKQYWVSASGNKKHPRKAVISCIKKNLESTKVYSTHKGGTKHINSKSNLFPERNWSSANPL